MSAAPLGRSLFLMRRQRRGFLALRAYDLHDTTSGDLVLTWRQQDPSWQTAVVELASLGWFAAFDLALRQPDGAILAWARRGYGDTFRGAVRVEDGQGRPLGVLRRTGLSLRDGFTVDDAAGVQVCASPGRDTNDDYREFRLLADRRELGWVGRPRAKLTTLLRPREYEVRIAERVPADSPTRVLILAAALAIDLVFDADDSSWTTATD
jgi:hypothetical protein